MEHKAGRNRRKTFDCVEMKNEIQRKMMAEFKARRNEFKTYADFINAKAEESPVVKAWEERLGFTHKHGPDANPPRK